MHTIYIKIFLEKKKPKDVNVHMENIKIFLKKKKTKSVNMLASNREIFLKSFNLFLIYKKLFLFRNFVFSGKCKKFF